MEDQQSLLTIDLGDLDFLCGDIITDEDIQLSQVCEEIEQEHDISEGLCQILSLDVDVNTDTKGGAEFGSFEMDYHNACPETTDSAPKLPAAKLEPNENDDTRFGEPATDEDISKLIASTENANTKKNTAWALRVFEEWRNQRLRNSDAEIPCLHVMTAEQLNFYLGRFIVETRRKDGVEYPPRSLYLITCGLLRHLRDKNVFDKNILDNNDCRFSEFRKILDSKMKDLLKRGFGTSIKQAEPIMPQDEESMWNKGIFGDKDSETLQHTMFYYNCKLFGLRGHDEHHELECSQFVLGTENSGKYVEFIGRASKTYKGGLAKMQLTNKRIRHHSSAGERCIADYYKMYLDGLDNAGTFYRRPLQGSPPKYGNQLVGVNKLKSMMKVICKKAGLEGNYSNHSGKRTCATQLYMAGVDEQEIMRRTGHRSEKAVRKYKQPCDDILKKVSAVLEPIPGVAKSLEKRKREDDMETETDLPCRPTKTLRSFGSDITNAKNGQWKLLYSYLYNNFPTLEVIVQMVAPPPQEIRLVGGDSNSGRVEVLYFGQWGTVCDDIFDNNDAKVVCRMLGKATTNAVAYGDAHYGEGTGPIYFDNLGCTGSEPNLYSCPRNLLGDHNCGHGEDAGVQCG